MFHKKIEASEMQTLKRGRIAPARSVRSVIPNPADSRTKKKIFPDTPFHRQPSMKAIDVLDFDIIKCGVEFVTGVGARPGVDDLLPHMERNEIYVYWMQLKGGSTDEQQACICVNGMYYALNNKLEKAIFRNVRLTRDFKKLRASRRWHAQARDPTETLSGKVADVESCANTCMHSFSSMHSSVNFRFTRL
jgi:hypothetical protein